jgi:CBS domain-containing protein
MGALGVTDAHGRFAGIVTERDLTWFVAQGRDATGTSVGSVVNDFPVVVEAPITSSAALERMRTARVRHLILREEGAHRIVSMRDLATGCRAPEPVRGCTARDVMTSPAVACRDTAFFEEVVETLAARDISGMPVVDHDGTVVGVISERDLAYALGGPMVRLALRRHGARPVTLAADLPREGRRAKDVMSAPPLTVTADASLEEIASLMKTRQVNRVPVVEDGRLLGIVTRGDVLGTVAHVDREVARPSSTPVLVGSSGGRP